MDLKLKDPFEPDFEQIENAVLLLTPSIICGKYEGGLKLTDIDNSVPKRFLNESDSYEKLFQII